jgi:hypothetical protein
MLYLFNRETDIVHHAGPCRVMGLQTQMELGLGFTRHSTQNIISHLFPLRVGRDRFFPLDKILIIFRFVNVRQTFQKCSSSPPRYSNPIRLLPPNTSAVFLIAKSF